ncbi:MAG TPA: hypothetical protein VGF17_15065, partial [Phytomonospora sp.]
DDGEQPADGAAAAVVAAARMEGEDVAPQAGDAAAAVDAARMETKSLDTTEVPDTTPHTYDPGDEEAHRVELAVATALEAILNRQVGVIAARLESPKTRRGTAYWVPESEGDTRVGDDPIDTARVVDTARWVAEAQESLRPTITAASQESASGLLEALAATGALVGAVPITAAVVGRPVQHAAATAEQVTASAGVAAAKATLFALATAQLAIEDWLQGRIADIDQIIVGQVTPDLPSVVTEVRRLWDAKAQKFARSLAITVSQTAVLGAREQAAAALTPQTATADTSIDGEAYTVTVRPEVTRTWRTRHDEHVRAAHRAADGQTVAVGEMFHVGGHELRFPSDPLAPPEVSRNCRCWVAYGWTAGSTFTVVRNDAPPVGMAEAA